MKKYVFASLLMLLFLNIFDVYSTHQIIVYKGGTEANPFVAWLMENFGLLPGMIIPKGIILGSLFLILIYKKISQTELNLFLIGVMLANFYYGYYMLTVNYMILIN